jgi:hypothetical protein
MTGRRLSALVVLSTLVLLGAPRPALADRVEAITVGPNQTLSKEYGPILAQEAVQANLGNVPPDTCELLPSCNLVPVDFTAPPNANKLDTYLAQIDVFWETQGIGDRNVGESTDDLDVWLWAAEWAQKDAAGDPCYVPPTDTEYEPPEYCTFPLAHSANTGPIVPETVRIDVQSHDHYLLVVNNSTGVNLGYRVDIASRYVAYDAPVESTEGAFAPPASGLEAPPFTGSGLGSSPSSSVIETGPSAGVPGAASLSPFADVPGADEDLTDLSATDINAALKGAQLKRTSNNFGPAAPVSDSTVVVWLVLVPLVLVGLGGWWLMRHRPAALRVRSA